MKPKKIALVSLVSSLMCLMGAPAQATLILRLSDGINNLSIVDNGGGDLTAAAGAITFIGAFGSTWNINVSTAIGTAAYLNGFGINLNSVNVSNAAGTLRVAITETDLNWGAPGPSTVPILGTIGAVTSGTVSYGLYTDNANTAFGTGDDIFTGSGSGAFGDSGGASVNLADPFSMSLILDINHSAAGNTSFNFGGRVVPEPAPLALIGLGIAALGFARRKVTG